MILSDQALKTIIFGQLTAVGDACAAEGVPEGKGALRRFPGNDFLLLMATKSFRF